jgi:hypothetical protein
MFHPSLQLSLIALAALFLAVAFSVPGLTEALGFASLSAWAYVGAAVFRGGARPPPGVLERRSPPGLAR